MACHSLFVLNSTWPGYLFTSRSLGKYEQWIFNSRMRTIWWTWDFKKSCVFQAFIYFCKYLYLWAMWPLSQFTQGWFLSWTSGKCYPDWVQGKGSLQAIQKRKHCTTSWTNQISTLPCWTTFACKRQADETNYQPFFSTLKSNLLESCEGPPGQAHCVCHRGAFRSCKWAMTGWSYEQAPGTKKLETTVLSDNSPVIVVTLTWTSSGFVWMDPWFICSRGTASGAGREKHFGWTWPHMGSPSLRNHLLSRVKSRYIASNRIGLWLCCVRNSLNFLRNNF